MGCGFNASRIFFKSRRQVCAAGCPLGVEGNAALSANSGDSCQESRPICRTDAALRGAPQRSLPAQQEKVAATEGAAVGLKKPMDGFLDGVSETYASKLDRSAIGTAGGKQAGCAVDHGANRPLSLCRPRPGRRCFGRADWSNLRGGRCAGRGQRGSPLALPLLVPAFSHRAPTA
jgi:hypothetical protein